MCTYITETVAASGSGKGPQGWFDLGGASVYFDHPASSTGARIWRARL